MQRSLTELFGAGSETSATTLLFALLYMIKHPETQVPLSFKYARKSTLRAYILDYPSSNNITHLLV